MRKVTLFFSQTPEEEQFWALHGFSIYRDWLLNMVKQDQIRIEFLVIYDKSNLGVLSEPFRKLAKNVICLKDYSLSNLQNKLSKAIEKTLLIQFMNTNYYFKANQFKTLEKCDSHKNAWQFLRQILSPEQYGIHFQNDPIQLPLTENTLNLGFHKLPDRIENIMYVTGQTEKINVFQDELEPFSNYYNFSEEKHTKTRNFFARFSTYWNRQNDIKLQELVDNLVDVEFTTNKLSVLDYELLLRESKFTLVARPPYYSESCSINRIYQAVACGCVPMLVDDTDRQFLPDSINMWLKTYEFGVDYDFDVEWDRITNSSWFKNLKRQALEQKLKFHYLVTSSNGVSVMDSIQLSKVLKQIPKRGEPSVEHISKYFGERFTKFSDYDWQKHLANTLSIMRSKNIDVSVTLQNLKDFI